MRRLIIRPGAIGDCILALPAVEFLSRQDQAETEVWAPSAVLPVVSSAVRTRSIASTGLDLLGLPGIEPPPSLLTDLSSFDAIISWYGANRVEFQDAIQRLWIPVNYLQALPNSQNRVHCADFFAGQVGAPVPAVPRIPIDNVVAGDYAVIHPFSGSARKNWPLPRYRALAARLAMTVRWCAGPDEELPGAIRFDNLYELARCLAGARIYIGNDSGITHLAAAAGARVVAIFGPTDPAIWGPRGDWVRIVRGKLEEIQMEHVYDAVCSLL